MKGVGKHLSLFLIVFSSEAKTADLSNLSGSDAEAKKPLTRAQIGVKMQISMMEGSSPDDQLLVNLVIDTLKRLGNEEEAKTGSQENFGWVLLNFPRNRAQAQLLEKELSGYEDPKPIKLGHLKRAPKDKNSASKDVPPPTTQHAAPTSAGRKRSLIAPSELKSEQKTPSAKSGLDMVFMIDLANDLVIQRATGRRIDTVSNDHYHLQFNSPSTTSPVSPKSDHNYMCFNLLLTTACYSLGTTRAFIQYSR